MPNCNVKKPVKIELSEEELKKLEEIKEHYGVNTYTEALRICIADGYRIMKYREKMMGEMVNKD